MPSWLNWKAHIGFPYCQMVSDGGDTSTRGPSLDLFHNASHLHHISMHALLTISWLLGLKGLSKQASLVLVAECFVAQIQAQILHQHRQCFAVSLCSSLPTAAGFHFHSGLLLRFSNINQLREKKKKKTLSGNCLGIQPAQQSFMSCYLNGFECNGRFPLADLIVNND